MTDALIIVMAFPAAVLARLLLEPHIDSSDGERLGNWNSAAGAVCLLLYGAAYIWTAQQYGLYSFRPRAGEPRALVRTCEVDERMICLLLHSCVEDPGFNGGPVLHLDEDAVRAGGGEAIGEGHGRRDWLRVHVHG
jgi:hypothetical protein